MRVIKKIAISIVLILVGCAGVIGILCYTIYYHEQELDQFISDAATNTRKAMMDAYNQQEWDKVVGYGLALEAHGDTIGDLTIIYAEGMCALGYYGKARTLLLDRIKSHPEDQVDYLYRSLGDISCCERKYDDAITYYTKSVEINPKYARPLVNMADVYREQHKYKEAVESYLKAIDLFYAKGLYNETESFSKAILEIDLKNVEAYIYLSATCYKRAEYDKYEAYKESARKISGLYATDKIHELIRWGY